jgi:hypothetical protein
MLALLLQSMHTRCLNNMARAALRLLMLSSMRTGCLIIDLQPVLPVLLLLLLLLWKYGHPSRACCRMLQHRC